MTVRAAIDVGSNSVKLLVLDIHGDGRYEILWDESRVTRLGRGMAEHGRLDPGSVQDTLECLAGFTARARKLGAEEIRAAGTAALRSAGDSDGFIEQVQREHGVQIEVLDGGEEAQLSRVVALRELARDFPVPGRDDAGVVFFDVGGGSTELTLCHGEDVLSACSLDLGARRCTEVACVIHPVTGSKRERLQAMISTALRSEAPMLEKGAPTVRLAGLGGTATSLVWLLMGVHGEGISNPHGAVVSSAEIEDLLGGMANQTPREVRGRRNLDPARADVIYAGAAIILELLRHYGAGEFVLVDRGLRFGLLLA